MPSAIDPLAHVPETTLRYASGGPVGSPATTSDTPSVNGPENSASLPRAHSSNPSSAPIVSPTPINESRSSARIDQTTVPTVGDNTDVQTKIGCPTRADALEPPSTAAASPARNEPGLRLRERAKIYISTPFCAAA